MRPTSRPPSTSWCSASPDGQPPASRTIAILEREIGASLLIRATRAVTLTEAGTDFLARIEPILADLDEAGHAARGSGELRGLLRVGLGTTMAVRIEGRLGIPAFEGALAAAAAGMGIVMASTGASRRELESRARSGSWKTGTGARSTCTRSSPAGGRPSLRLGRWSPISPRLYPTSRPERRACLRPRRRGIDHALDFGVAART
jgi:DNA-binding transcriptional LysR family regulator